jgi:hypothetical protein
MAPVTTIVFFNIVSSKASHGKLIALYYYYAGSRSRNGFIKEASL